MGSSKANFVYGSQSSIYLGKSEKKAIFGPFMTKGAISRKETTVNQNWLLTPYFRGLDYNIYFARCPQ